MIAKCVDAGIPEQIKLFPLHVSKTIQDAFKAQ